ncbi:DNA repair ATPase [Psychromonas sp. CD1]|uniref:DNA repair ATPase n=1 Tax=Psychromonas sp. CD1 TaxID=1979839 RepID=UPI000B9A3318|nr:DNA repair ATPase [Psychromonas sp. CD1]
MLYTIIFILVGLLLFVLIGYNIIQQYRQKIDTERRLATSKQRAIIAEVDELLLQATNMPFSQSLLLILQHRIKNALIFMLKTSSERSVSVAIQNHLSNTNLQIKELQKSYTPPDESIFKTPQSDREALVLLQIAKKIRAVLRSEHAKGKVSTQNFVVEDRRLEMMQLKINIENSLKKIYDSKNSHQYGSANQMINKLIIILSSMADKDSYLSSKETQLIKLRSEIKKALHEKNDKKLQEIKEREAEKKNDIDFIFQEKKKW